MPAHNDSFPWMSYYQNYQFFEDKMRSHSKVSDVQNLVTGLYMIALVDREPLRVFICECYSFGLAEYYESVEKLGRLDAVIINSNWCEYTMEAKLHCRKMSVGLFDIGGFMAALNRRNHWEYLTRQEEEYLEKNGLL